MNAALGVSSRWPAGSEPQAPYTRGPCHDNPDERVKEYETLVFAAEAKVGGTL